MARRLGLQWPVGFATWMHTAVHLISAFDVEPGPSLHARPKCETQAHRCKRGARRLRVAIRRHEPRLQRLELTLQLGRPRRRRLLCLGHSRLERPALLTRLAERLPHAREVLAQRLRLVVAARLLATDGAGLRF